MEPSDTPTWPPWSTAWERVYAHLVGLPPGHLVTLDTLLQLTESALPRAQAALRRARRKLQREHNRWLIAVPKQGYRVIDATEHAGVAMGYRHASRRKLRTAVALTVHVNLAEITKPEDLARLEWTQKVLMLSSAFVDQVAKLKALPAREDLRLPTTRDLLHVVDRTRRERTGKSA